MKEKQVHMHATVCACWGREQHAEQQKEPSGNNWRKWYL